MPAILGIDPAWTATKSSGIALLQGDGQTWRCVAVSPSYRNFTAAAAGAHVDWSIAPTSGEPDIDVLLVAARMLLNGAAADLVTIDMPVATVPIANRRAADKAISTVFGGRGCSVHSPSAQRPGLIGEHLCQEFAARGYPLATTAAVPGSCPALLEVFPHTALLALLDADYRIPYKIAKAAKYWPSVPPAGRRANILFEWRRILGALGKTIGAIPLQLPDAGTHGNLKRYEDALDALVCAWVGIMYLTGRATAYGDATAAIWSP